MNTAEQLVIRPYGRADWEGVCRVHDAARPLELAAGGVDPRAFRPMLEAAEGDEFFVSETAVACWGGALAGFVSWRGDYVTWLYVDPELQRRGIGSRLLAHALEAIGPQAWTNALAENEPAVSLYLRAGFEVVWRRASECDGYPCTAMRLALPTSRMRDPAARREAVE